MRSSEMETYFMCRNSQFQDIYTLEQILQSPKIFDPLTKLQCCPTSDGAAAAIVCSENFVIRHGLFEQAIEILGMEMVTDLPSSFSGSAMSLVSLFLVFLTLSLTILHLTRFFISV